MEGRRFESFPPTKVTVTEAAKQLGIARVTLSRLIHGQSGVFGRYGSEAGSLAEWSEARAKRRELAEDAGRLRSVANDATAGAESHAGTKCRIVISYFMRESELHRCASCGNREANVPISA